MTTRHSSPSLVCALAFALVVAPTFVACAQTATDTSSSNAAPAAPAAAPAATAAPAMAAPADTTAAPAPASAERPATYTLVKGDSLWTVAHRYGTTVVKLRKLNNLKKGAILQPGQVLQIPPATSDTK
jgi:LysM repeat protein